MAYDEGVAQRLREGFEALVEVTEKKMFGGVAFMVGGHMACGVVEDRLMVRVGPDAYSSALQLPHAREMNFTGRPLKGFVYVDSDGFADDRALLRWIEMSLDFVTTLPAKS